MDAKYTPFDRNTESPEMKADVYQNNTRLRLHRKNQPKIFLETKIQHKDHTFSAPDIPQFNTKNPSVQHRKPLNSTHPSVQHPKPLSSTLKTAKFWRGIEGFLVLNLGVFGVELRGVLH